jgi:organic radical activating enzyme
MGINAVQTQNNLKNPVVVCGGGGGKRRISLDKIAQKMESFIPPYLFAFMKDAYFSRIKLKPLKRLRFTVHLTDHCNLNCRGCDNFSPIATDRNIDVSVFERDLARIQELTKGNIDDVQLLGGEPLLHPQINLLLETARKYIRRETPVRLVSNGILLTRMTDEFWNCCVDNNIKISVTKYPINIDHDTIENLTKKFKVEFSYHGDTGENLKKMFCDPLELEGKQNIKTNFIRCHRANNCIELNDGKLYTCETIPNVKYFNRFFNKDLKVTEDDYIDIYKAKDINEILNFLCNPPPFCRYCDIDHKRRGIKWAVSRKELAEWT